jgi:hypothetical protein
MSKTGILLYRHKHVYYYYGFYVHIIMYTATLMCSTVFLDYSTYSQFMHTLFFFFFF